MRRLVVALVALVALAGCSTSKDAVAQDQEFQFVAPGGQSTITYDPPSSRGTVHGIAGESLLRPGTTVGTDDYAGRVVVVNIWGSWCGPCREEVHDLQAVQDQTGDRGVTVLGIDFKDKRDDASDFLTDRAISYDSIFDPAGRSLAQLHGYPRNVVPSTIVLDKEHRVAAVFLAQVHFSELLPLLMRISTEPG